MPDGRPYRSAAETTVKQKSRDRHAEHATVEDFVVWVAGEPEDCFAGAGADCFGLLGFVAGAGVAGSSF